MRFSVAYFITILNILLIQTTISSYGLSENVDSRIVGGTPGQEKGHPFYAAIAVQKPNKIMLCSGSIISRQWILTSAQCIDEGEEFSIGIGKANLDDYEINKLLVSTSAIKHEEFNKITLDNDIGLIKLPKIIVFSDRINATRLPSRKLSQELLNDENATVSGHGTNESIYRDISTNLISLEVNIMDILRCVDYYGAEIISFNLICSTALEGQGPCFNDTGDPLIMKEADGYATLIGIFSYFHEEGCDLGYPSVYTRVGRYIDWIYDKTGIPVNEDNSSNSIYVSKIVLSLLLVNIIPYFK